MRIITKIIAIMAICFVLGTIGLGIHVYNSPSYSDQSDDRYIEFSINTDERTLIVADIKNINLKWEDISLYDGDATLPSSGVVKVGNVITDCYGIVTFNLPDGSIFGGWEFSERPIAYYEDIRFIGSWEGEGQEFNFYSNGTYFNYIETKLDHGDDDTEHEWTIKRGDYKTEKHQLLLNESGEIEQYECDVSFSIDDTQLEITCPPLELYYRLQRSFTDNLYITILNVSEKLDDCLSFFISKYSNETHQAALSEGFNTTVVFTNELIHKEIENLTLKNIVFNMDHDGNITPTGLNYSVQINTLQDVYNLVSRVDVKEIIADDSKFNDIGCSITILPSD